MARRGLPFATEDCPGSAAASTFSRREARSYATSFIQTTATLGFFLALLVIGSARFYIDGKAFADWGWAFRSWCR
jgi:hypothetical protein